MNGQCDQTAETRVAPLPVGLPHTAYVLLWYPLFTQPFIYREVEELRKRLPLEVHSLYDHNLRHCSDEMLASADNVRTLGVKAVPRLIFATLKMVIRKPALFFGLFRRSMFRKWKSLETFGENLWAFFCGIYLAELFALQGIDLIYAPWPRGSATAAWVASSVTGLPFATSARGDNLDPTDPDLPDKLEAALFIRANNASDQKRINDLLGNKNTEKTFLVYNSLTLPAPDFAQSEHVLRKAPFRMLALGRFDVTKGFDILLHACDILREQGLDFHLTLAGGGGTVMGLGQLSSDLENLRKTLGLENHVDMPGIVSHNDLPAILKSHDIFVAPCIIHSSGRRDGIPNTVIEALSYGLPVVSTTVNALPEVVRDHQTGLAVSAGNPLAIAKAVMWLARNPDKAREMGSNGARLAREMFDPALNSQRLADFFISRYKDWKAKCAG